MLSDDHINVASQDLATRYQHLGGFLDPVFFLSSAAFVNHCVLNDAYILISHTKSHWVTVTSITFDSLLYDPCSWFLYDSLHNDSYYYLAQQMLLRLNSSCKLKRLACQTQHGFDDCGLFSIANAITLCEGRDPSSIFYNQSFMRAHYDKCILNKEFSRFN